nr:nose resistant to fluoxetine protein 6-like isoform X1 [Danaus plexippus plexippus]XP_032520060.1 nose resistant to fluoxetine protein 6-like isoform X3 [Danaus plexippus plexippus]
MVRIFAFLMLIKSSLAVIYSVNESEYRKMPRLFKMDDYKECMLETGGTYCVATYDLHSRGHSNLMRFIREYSEHTIKHFNHTQMHRATCVTITCKDVLNQTSNRKADVSDVLERCINDTVWRHYRLEARLSELLYCNKDNDKMILDASDYVVASVYIVIFLINTIGSFYDLIFCNDDSKKGNPYLLSFSVKQNWKRLTSPGGSGDDPRIERLKLFNGLRAMTIVCVIFSHTALIMTITYVSNPHFIEKAYDDPLKQILFNGTLVTHTFFVMSGFLLAYNLQIHSEKTQITWSHIPKGILLRWIRLTPPYALVIATIATWMRHIGSGPLWKLVVISESNYCRNYWWANIFYFNNYVYQDDLCFPQGWYLAADTQLFCVGLFLFVMVQGPRARKMMLSILFLLSLVITASLTYFQDLDPVVIQSPETYRSYYVNDKTFNLMYIPGHTNLSTYSLGLAGGFLCYHWQMKEIDLSKLKYLRLYQWVTWILFPIGVGIILAGGIFYLDGVTHSTFLKVTYAAFNKPLFQALVTCFIVGSIFKLENVYRPILEWKGFTWAGRVSYSAFLLHTIFQRSYAGAQTNELIVSEYNVFILLSASIFLSFLCATFLWLVVEAPVAGLTRALLNSNKLNK